MTKPLSYLFLLLGLSGSIALVNSVEESELLSHIDGFRNIAFLFLLMWFLVRFIKGGETIFLQRAETAEQVTTVTAVARLLRVAVIITGAVMLLQALGYSVHGVLAFGGVGGIAVGFAAKDLLANFFGSLVIYLDKPFVVGDWVRSPDRNIEGTVEHIGWRMTHIRTFDKRPLYVPNSIFSNISVENPSRMQNRRINEVIGVRYDDAAVLAKIVADVRSMLESHPDIDSEQTLIVNFDTFAASSLNFFIYTFTKTTNWVQFHAVKQDVLLQILSIIEGHNAEIAFPTTTVHLQEAHNGEPA
jgi:MscS family membrane protein